MASKIEQIKVCDQWREGNTLICDIQLWYNYAVCLVWGTVHLRPHEGRYLPVGNIQDWLKGGLYDEYLRGRVDNEALALIVDTINRVVLYEPAPPAKTAWDRLLEEESF